MGVGLFSASKDWSAGDTGVLRDVLVAGGAPVEYGQAPFAIEKR